MRHLFGETEPLSLSLCDLDAHQGLILRPQQKALGVDGTIEMLPRPRHCFFSVLALRRLIILFQDTPVHCPTAKPAGRRLF